MFAKHAIEQEKQDVTFKQSGWASARANKRWNTEMEVSLRMYLWEEFSKACSWHCQRKKYYLPKRKFGILPPLISLGFFRV